MSERMVLDVSGVRTYVRVSGRGQPPLVLMHGVLSDGDSWSGVLDRLGRDRTLIVPDLPLHGRSETSEDFRAHPEGMVAWLTALLDALNVPVSDVCGLSMGGAVAVHFAKKKPDRLRRLVLVDAANIVPLSEPYKGLLAEAREMIEAMVTADTRKPTQGWTDGIDLEGAKTAIAEMCADPIVMSVLMYLEDRGISLQQVVTALDLLEPVGEDGLRAISAPTLVIWGEEDPFFPSNEAAALLRRTLPHGQVEVLEGVGHNPVSDAPEAYLDLMSLHLG
jgi:pimeloyl-ACP methyl ester carboxylesterase